MKDGGLDVVGALAGLRLVEVHDIVGIGEDVVVYFLGCVIPRC